MSYPLISVIVPCYNVEKFLPNCFKCLENQSYKNLHVIFVNDGSTDDTLKILEEYCRFHSGNTLINGENRGVACARNSGLDAIKGEFFAFYDADDILYTDHFETLFKNVTESGADMAVCGIKRISEKRAAKFDYNRDIKADKIRVFDKQEALEQFFSQEKFDYLLMNKIFSAKILKESGARFLDNCRYGEEGYFFYKYLLSAEKTVYYGAKTYVYVQNKHSLMHSGFSEKRFDVYINIGAVLKEISVKEELSDVLPYVRVMRAGYSVGILHFILHSKYRNACVIARIVSDLKNDVKYLKKCPKVALYKKIFLPPCATLAKIMFRKQIKRYDNSVSVKTRERVSSN